MNGGVNQHLWKEPFVKNRANCWYFTSIEVLFELWIACRSNPGPDILRVDFDLDDYKRRWGL